LKAVIMAGGEGSRLRPLTCDRPKPMVPICDKPMMEYIVELLLEHNVRDLAVTLQYLPEKIKDYFGNGEDFNVNFVYFLEDEPLGTAGSVKNASSFLDETFLVISGDCLTDINLTEAMEFHRRNKALATIVLTPQENPLEYGIVITDEKGKITRFLEKPRWGEVFSDTVNTGIYILEPEVLDYVPAGKKFDFSKDLFPLLMKNDQPLFGCVLSGYWCDIGSIEQYRQAHYDILERKVKLRLNAPEKEKGIWLGEGVEIHKEAILQPPLYIGRNTRIGAKAHLGSHTCLGAYNRIGERATIKKGISWSYVHVGKGAVIRGGVLANKVRLEAEGGMYEGSVAGDDGIIGNKAIIKPDIKIWPCKVVESGAIVRDNLIWSKRANCSLFGQNGIVGELNVCLTPDNMMRLGSAFAFVQGPNARLVIGSDTWKPSKLLKQAFIVGLLAGGAEVIDIGFAPAPAVRLAVADLQAGGSIYIHASSKNGESRIHFFDKEGLNIPQALERKIEQVYWRDDFTRADKDRLGVLRTIEGYDNIYKEILLKNIAIEKIKNAAFSLLLVNPSLYMQTFLLPVLQNLNFKVMVWHPVNEGEAFEDNLSLQRKDITQEMVNRDFDLGFWLSPSAEDLILFDEKGREISKDHYQALLTLLAFKSGRFTKLAMPLSASWVHEYLARENKGSILRSKTSTRHLQEKIKEINKTRQNLYYPPDYLQVDCLAGLLKIIEYLAENKKKTLSELIKEIPQINIRQKEIFCPWDQKGMVMRRLTQEAPNHAVRVEMSDGIKAYHPEGWALVLPDPEKPSYQIYGEGFTAEIAESLTDFYADRVKALQEGQGKEERGLK
jgi:mannose-1-phosphate guanylyltransferase/phosphomannomutase